MKILILDNYDSFTYNISNCIKELGYDNIDVVRNDKIALEKIKDYDKIIFSPGPGVPSQAGILKEAIKEYAKSKSMLGICLGHQAMGEVFGAKLVNLKNLYHAVESDIYIDREDKIFEGLTSPFKAGRYHSWIVSAKDFPSCLEVIASDSSKMIMALRHKDFDIRGVQFHPESILTPKGSLILKNFLEK